MLTEAQLRWIALIIFGVGLIGLLLCKIDGAVMAILMMLAGFIVGQATVTQPAPKK